MKLFSNRGISVLLIIVMMAALVSGCTKSADTGQGIAAEPQKVYRWRMVTHQMPGTARYDNTILPFVKSVEEASGGRLIIEPYGGGVLFPTTETFDAVQNGIVEVAAIWTGFWGGIDPFFALAASVPADPINGFGEWYYRSEQLEPLISEVYEKYGVKSLGSFDFGPSEIFMSNKAVRSLEDFSGMSIRSAGIGGEFYTRLGASTVSLSAPEIYQALQLNTVDGAEYNDWIVNAEIGLNEVTKYVISPALHSGSTDDKWLIVNPDAWNELPEDLQAIVLQARDVARYSSAHNYAAMSVEAKQSYVNAGTEIIYLPESEVAKAADVATEILLDWKGKNEYTAKFIDQYAKILSDLGYDNHAAKLGYTK